MKFERLLPKLPVHAGDYRFAWIFSFALATAAAPLVVIFKDSAPWLMAIFLALGAIVVFVYEAIASYSVEPNDLDFLVSLPKGFAGLKSYEHFLALEVPPRKKIPKNQLSLFPGFTEPTPTNSIRVIEDKSTGKPMLIVNCDRYSALLITYLLDNLDKATEKSLQAGLVRFGKLGKGESDIQLFVQDKGIREAIKSDFRGNLVTLISKGGEKVAKDLLKTLETKQSESQALEAQKVGVVTRVHS
jgi:hypothetical protein